MRSLVILLKREIATQHIYLLVYLLVIKRILLHDCDMDD